MLIFFKRKGLAPKLALGSDNHNGAQFNLLNNFPNFLNYKNSIVNLVLFSFLMNFEACYYSIVFQYGSGTD